MIIPGIPRSVASGRVAVPNRTMVADDFFGESTGFVLEGSDFWDYWYGAGFESSEVSDDFVFGYTLVGLLYDQSYISRDNRLIVVLEERVTGLGGTGSPPPSTFWDSYRLFVEDEEAFNIIYDPDDSYSDFVIWEFQHPTLGSFTKGITYTWRVEEK